MLTASQVRTVAITDDAAVYHVECARQKFSGLEVAKAEAGLTELTSLTPLSSYEISNWIAEDQRDQYEIEQDEEGIYRVYNDDGEVAGPFASYADAEVALWELPAGPTCDHCYDYISD